MSVFVGLVDEVPRSTVDAGAAIAPRHQRMLEMLRQARIPVYIETDDATGATTRLLIPAAVHVHNVADQSVDDRLDVDLRVSNASDFLSVKNPDYPRLVEALRTAQRQRTAVLVTRRADRPEIIDVRPATESMRPRDDYSRPAISRLPEIRVETTAVPASVAQAMFDVVNAETCPTTVSALTCIPFLYPDQGCWARSHEMCRIMIAHGVIPAKVWSYGRRNVPTRNHPNCDVAWNWHAAPILGDIVIDPSLFDGPATLADWIARQPIVPPSFPGDGEFTDAAVYWTSRVSPDGLIWFDTQFTSTSADLVRYRLEFAHRCGIANPPGPPYDCK